jgi:formylglycine-generating enzyme required for sulfatase activity
VAGFEVSTEVQTAGQCNGAARPKDPVNCIDWSEAKAFCSWIGGRLPTAEEWEYAAKSGESRIFPWGNAPPDPSKAHFDSTETAPVATHRAGDTKWGLSDMAGNVWEWTASDFDDAHKEVRGGGRFLFPKGLRASSRGTAEPGERSGGIGLRCRL